MFLLNRRRDPSSGRVADRQPAPELRRQRETASVTYRRTFAKRNSVVAFLGLNNVLAHQNINEFRYSPDFSVREPVNSLAPRSLYFGVWLSR